MARSASAFKVMVKCPSCNDARCVSARQARRIRLGQYNSECVPCQKGIPNPAYIREPPDDEDKRFWLDRFSVDELKDIAGGIWDPVTVLTASAEKDQA